MRNTHSGERMEQEMEHRMNDEKKTSSDAPKKRGRPKAPPKPKQPKPPKEQKINSYAKRKATEYAVEIAERVTDDESKKAIIAALDIPEESMPARDPKYPTHKKPPVGTNPRRWSPETDEDRALVSQMLHELLTEYRKPPVRSDEELAQRFSDYYIQCAEEGRTPVWEEACLSTGYTAGSLWRWECGIERGFTDLSGELVKKAKAFQQSFDAKLVTAGKMNFLAYCFRSKCYYGMRDNAELPETTRNPMGEANLTPKQLQERYLQGMRESDYEDKTIK